MNLMRTKFTLLAAVFSCATVGVNSISAQNRCGTVIAEQQLISQNPIARKGFDKAQREMDEWLVRNPNGDESRVVVTIPVVVHVVYQNGTQNISDAQVQSQITALNKDFRRTNSDANNTPAAFQGVASDTEIEFCLATKDPNGNATTGILHVAATGQYAGGGNFGTSDDVKAASSGGSTIWNRNNYLNIWVCNLGSGLLGYAYQPGAPASIDGVVIDYNYFGTMGTAQAPYNLGRTGTHEVGHWLNLDHIWGDDGSSCGGSDNVSDTPNQAGENYSCPNYPRTDACSPSAPGVMFMNYMDYVDDNCMNMFTAGQKTRMQSALNGPRVSLKTSTGCSGGASQTIDAGITNIVSPSPTLCTTTFQPQVTLSNAGNVVLTSATINYTITSGPSGNYNWTGNLSVGGTVTITLPAVTVTAGAHTITMTVSNPNNGTDANASNNSSSKSFTVTNSTGVAAPYTETFQGAVNWTINNPNNDSYLWAVYNNGGQASSTKSIYINNYDNNAKGTIDEFILPAVNTSTLSSPVVDFWVAHKYYPYMNGTTGETWIDTLQVLYSIDCGVTYTSIGKLSGRDMVNNLNSDTLSTTGFAPTGANNWKKFFGNIPSSSSVTIKFRNINQYGQNIYLDNINVHTQFGTSIEEIIENEAFSVYPNPTSGQFTAKYEATKKGEISVQVLDLTGRELSTLSMMAQEGTNEFVIPLSNFAAGYYLVRLSVGDKIAIRKLIVE